METVRILTEKSPSCLNRISNNGRSVLHTACLAGHLEVVKFLVQHPGGGGLVNCQDSCGNSPLMDAARAGHLNCVQYLVSIPDLEVGAEDKMGRTVVQVAAEAGALDILKFLYQKLDISVIDNVTILTAAREGQAEVIQYLLECGASHSCVDSHGRTPLFLSVSGQHTEAARVLLEAGADVNVEDSQGNKLSSLARKLAMVNLMGLHSNGN